MPIVPALTRIFQLKKPPVTSGIYWLRNCLDGKFYIGSSDDLWERWRHHVNDLRAGKHVNGYLQAAWNKHGSDSFHFEVIEVAPVADLLVIEQWYLDHTRCLDGKYGYNLRPEASGMAHKEETRKKISDALKKRCADPEYREKLRQRGLAGSFKGAAACRGKKLSAERRAQIGKMSRILAATPEGKRARVEGGRKGCGKKWANMRARQSKDQMDLF